MSADSKKPAIAYDASSLVRSVSGVTVWVRYAYPNATEAKDRIEFDCTRRLRRISYSVEYNTDGGVTDEGTVGGEWKVVVPDTQAHAVFRKVCA